jgi:lysophospholipase L1-like esterase
VRTPVTWSLAAVAVVSIAACTGTGSATPLPEASSAPASAAPVEAGEGSTTSATDAGSEIYRLVTLGDSYTWGTGTDAPRRDSWPAQLADALTQRSDMRVFLYNLAEESQSSGQLLDEQLGKVASYEPDVVTVQVGVNDIVGNATEWYEGNITTILDELLLFMPPERIFAITTPDHTLTDWGHSKRPEAVDALNATLEAVAAERGITVIDIGQVNDLVATDESLLVQDEPPVPYPTAKQYAGWVEAIGPYIYDALTVAEP